MKHLVQFVNLLLSALLGAALLATVASGGTTLAAYTYNDAGEVTAQQFGNGVAMSATLDPLGRPTLQEYRKAGTLRLGFGAAYDAAG